jgi:hypothetical protein
MSIKKTDFDSIVEDDLCELIDAQVSEGLRLDFKLTSYGKSDSDKRELLKDVSAFANSHGGHLVLGVKESEGVAVEITGIDVDADSEILRIEQILRNAIEPPISGIRIRSITLESGRKVILLRIPRSWNPPHRVTAKGINKFYLRHSAGVHEPSIEELRALFEQSSTALEKARQFRNKRIIDVCNGEGERPLVGEGRLFIHIVPTASFSGMVNLDVEDIHKKHDAFWPLGASGITPRFNFYGYINERGGKLNYGYTQIFRNGILEATMSSIVRNREDRAVIPGLGLEEYIFQRISKYIDGLRDIGVPSPLIVMFSFEGVKGAKYVVVSNPWDDDESPLPDDLIYLPECILEEYGTTLDHHRAVRPAFNALWNTIGYSKSQFFNEEGLWVGKVDPGFQTVV